MKKLFKKHRGGLKDSLDTTIEVDGIEDIEKYLNTPYPAYRNVRIQKDPITDTRLPEEWGTTEYYVLADVGDFSSGVVGMCNFLE